MIQFIHAADLHLDTPFTGIKNLPESWKKCLKNSPYQALDKIIHTAIQHQVDFVIFSGDIYDQHSRGFKAQMALQKACQRLDDARIQTFIAFGNHDYSDDSLLDLKLPESVYIFPKEVTTTYFESDESERVALTGFSYWARHIKEPIIKEFPMKSSDADYQIGVYHGQVGNPGDPYAPFQIQEMQSKQYNYWALGHIHQFQQLSAHPPIIYSGTPQGRHPLETGEKGIQLIKLSKNHFENQFVATQDIQFLRKKIEVKEETQEPELIMQKILDFLHEQPKDTIYRLDLVMNHLKNPTLIEWIENESWRHHLNSLLEQQRQWIDEISVKLDFLSSSVEPMIESNFEIWQETEKELMSDSVFFEVIGDLVEKHPIPHRDFFDRDYRQELLEKARTELLK